MFSSASVISIIALCMFPFMNPNTIASKHSNVTKQLNIADALFIYV